VKIVYHSFEGRHSDNPRALHQAATARTGSEHEHVWLADPAHAHGFPPEVTTVPFGTPQARAALESADLVVSNTHLDLDWDKAPGAVYLQTWHGTPLKRIHHDVLFAPEGRLERLDLDVARWDLLLSPNEASTPLLTGAFGFDGPVHETGYPRNDVLSAPDAQARRARVREQLGIADGVRAVLYARTWRDDDLFGEGPDFTLRFDVDRFRAELGEDHVLLLRLHYMVSAALAGQDLPGVVDVSHHPDISDLYLAADVLVTDYSSVQFDFAVTGKPILYHVHDLEHYRDVLRGFYFDFEEIAAGPLLATSEEVVAALGDLDAVVAANADRYAAFQARFCSLEDGHASDRVLDLVLQSTHHDVPEEVSR
jgi:CDP-glycerol glycerophosphotransferase